MLLGRASAAVKQGRKDAYWRRRSRTGWRRGRETLTRPPIVQARLGSHSNRTCRGLNFAGKNGVRSCTGSLSSRRLCCRGRFDCCQPALGTGSRVLAATSPSDIRRHTARTCSTISVTSLVHRPQPGNWNVRRAVSFGSMPRIFATCCWCRTCPRTRSSAASSCSMAIGQSWRTPWLGAKG